MAKIAWDDRSKYKFESGIDRCVFYPSGSKGVAWNGLTSVKESTESADQTVYYYDGNTYVNHVTLGNYSATIEAFTYPDEFTEYEGPYDEVFSYQPHKTFNLSYRTKIGTDTGGDSVGYKLHLIYNATASQSDRNYSTIVADVTPMTFSWDITTVPVSVPDARPTSHIIIDTRYVWIDVLTKLEEMLYGTSTSTPHFPTMDELLTLFEENSLFRIIDHGDGTFTATSPLDHGDLAYVKLASSTVIELMSPTVELLESETYSATTL